MNPSSRTSKPVIGIVGGIGAGKSAAAAEFARLGCALIEGDEIGHELLETDEVRREVVARWGEGVLNSAGKVDRSALAKIVFADTERLKSLNAILHGRIRERIEAEICRAQADPAFAAIVLDAAVLFEAGWDDLCSHVVFVSAPREERLDRLRRARGWDEEAVRQREKSQISLDKKAGRCDYTMDNSSSASHLRERIRDLFQRIVQ